MYDRLKYYIYIYILNTALLSTWLLLIIIRRNGITFLFKKKLICIYYEPQFQYIVKELIKSGYNIVYIPRQIFEYSFFNRLEGYIIEQEKKKELFCLDEYIKYTDNIKKYEKDLKNICKSLKSITRATLFILPKMNDPWIIQVVDILTRNNWKTIVYDREGVVTPKRMEYVPATISKFNIRCTAIVTENELHRNFFLAVKDYGNLNCDILINGNPRSDYWFQEDINYLKDIKHKNTPRKYLYFSFGHKNYVNFYYDKDPGSEKYNWTSLLNDIHNSLFSHFSTSNDELIYKTYHASQRDYFIGVEKLKKLSNVSFFDERYNAYDLINDSDVIIGFQTAALIEAMYTDKPIIYCGWGESFEKIKDTLIDYHILAINNGLTHAKNSLELKDLMTSNLESFHYNLEERKKFRYKYMHNEHGDVARNFVKIINSYF